MYFLLIFVLPLVLAFFWSRWIDRKHFARIVERETEYSDITVTDLRTFPGGREPEAGELVTGATVVANDYFKTWAASIRNIFGGEVRGLERLLERGRRESMVRMLAEARALGANAVYNVRIDTSSIAGKRAGAAAGVEVLVSGTAVKGG
jgi:uncharacterized protein YbjQ (UPF0145 family)